MMIMSAEVELASVYVCRLPFALEIAKLLLLDVGGAAILRLD